MGYELTELTNGFRVASEKLPGVESVAVSVSVDVGARYEEKNEGGVAHLLEHMAFKGTKRRTARDIAEQFDNIGGQFNAYTSLEHTVYYAKVLKGDLPLAVDILADILQESLFDAEELERERGVILQEIAMHHDTPEDLIYDVFDETAFPDQALGRSILGKPEQIESYQRDHILRYMQKHYHAPRMALSCAGNVDHAQLVKLAETHFHLPRGAERAPAEPGRYRGGDKRDSRDLEQLHMMLGLEALPVLHADYYALQLMSSILGGGMSSRLFQEIREKRGLCYHVGSMVSAYRDCGVMTMYTATGEAESAEVPRLMIEELKKVADRVDEKELLRAKNQQKAELLMARENPGAVAGWIGKHLLIFGHYRQYPEIVERIDNVTIADIQRLAAQVAQSAPTLAALGPVGKLPGHEQLQHALAA